MTRNQLEYWNLQETKRHNAATEGETGRHNVAEEGETKRHNVMSESEMQRHNMRTEMQTDTNLLETQRHNIATEGYTKQSVAETQRANRASESIRREQNRLESQKLGLTQSQIAESIRHNIASEGISLSSLAETQRSNKARESLTAMETSEMIRHNKENELVSYLNTGISAANSVADIAMGIGKTRAVSRSASTPNLTNVYSNKYDLSDRRMVNLNSRTQNNLLGTY
jgi:inorganic pyrophosphatase/exopolyphosphatase